MKRCQPEKKATVMPRSRIWSSQKCSRRAAVKSASTDPVVAGRRSASRNAACVRSGRSERLVVGRAGQEVFGSALPRRTAKHERARLEWTHWLFHASLTRTSSESSGSMVQLAAIDVADEAPGGVGAAPAGAPWSGTGCRPVGVPVPAVELARRGARSDPPARPWAGAPGHWPWRPPRVPYFKESAPAWPIWASCCEVTPDTPMAPTI